LSGQAVRLVYTKTSFSIYNWRACRVATLSRKLANLTSWED